MTTRPGVAIDGLIQQTPSVVVLATTAWNGRPASAPPPADASQVVALERTTGRVLWHIDVPDDYDHAVAAADDVIFLHTRDGVLSALDAPTGEHLWRSTDVSSGNDDVSIVVEDDAVVLAPGGRGESVVTTYDAATGDALWASMYDGRSWPPPVVANGIVVVASWRDGLFEPVSEGKAGVLTAYDLATGTTQWVRETEIPLLAEPVPTETGLVVLASDPVLGCD